MNSRFPLLAAWLICATGGASAKILFKADFETGDLSEWSKTGTRGQNATPRNVQVVSDIVQQGKYAAKVTIHEDDVFNERQLRAQMGGPRITVEEGSDTYLSFYLYMAEAPKDRDNFFYWEGAPPPRYNNVMTWWVEPKEGGGALIQYGTGNLGRNGTEWRADFAIGKWHQLAMHIHWSEDPAKGNTRLWFDGALVLDRKLKTKGPESVYFCQPGIHRSPHRPSVDTIYFDNFVMADTLEEVVQAGAAAAGARTLPTIAANDNRIPAGTFRDGVLHVEVELRKGNWHPEAEDGEAIPSYAFAEAGKPLQVPGPAIRVLQGATIDMTVRNSLSVPVTLHGLHQRPGSDGDVVTVDPGATRQVRFAAGRAGTYLYWGRTPDGRRGNGRVLDALLGGALVVDPPGAKPANDRIFVLERWNGPTRTAINGKSWPYTERLNFQVGEKVQWKIINASDLSHPMHLHGFHFSLDGEGDGEKYKIFDDGMKPEEFTHSVEVMQTFDMTWMPKEPGRWLYHCHRIPHMRLPVPLDPNDAVIPAHDHDHEHMHDMNSPYSGMGGMIMGITVSGRTSFDTETSWNPARRLAMRVGARQGDARFHEISLKDLVSGKESSSTGLTGPLLVVTQGQQTEIAITNALATPTAIHWHGLEIESYYDGVPGWGGLGDRRAPAVEPGQTFTVRMIPRRAGSFFYHTHWHDAAQLTGGVHGPMIVMPAGQAHDPAIDKSFLMSLSPNEPFGAGLLLMNGVPQPAAMRLRAGTAYRFRFMNITPTMDNLRMSLRGPAGLVEWRPVAKDAAPVKNSAQRAADQRVAVGETFDFEYRATSPGELRLEGWSPGDNRRAVQTLIFE